MRPQKSSLVCFLSNLLQNHVELNLIQKQLADPVAWMLKIEIFAGPLLSHDPRRRFPEDQRLSSLKCPTPG